MPESSVAEVLARLVAEDPGRPRVTWYGPDTERVELSSRTLLNWVAKTTHLLLGELEAEPEMSVGLDLPVHWRTVVWSLATWSVGAHAVVLTGPVTGQGVVPDVVVSTHGDHPGVHLDALAVVALPALATRYPGEMPLGALDVAFETRLQPDDFPTVLRPYPDTPAFTAGDATTTYAELLAPLPQTRPRLLTDAGLGDAPHAYLRPLLAGGSVVLHHALADLDDAARQRLIDQEGVTATG